MESLYGDEEHLAGDVGGLVGVAEHVGGHGVDPVGVAVVEVADRRPVATEDALHQLLVGGEAGGTGALGGNVDGHFGAAWGSVGSFQ